MHEKGINNEHEMSIQPNDYNIAPYKKANSTAKTLEFSKYRARPAINQQDIKF